MRTLLTSFSFRRNLASFCLLATLLGSAPQAWAWGWPGISETRRYFSEPPGHQDATDSGERSNVTVPVALNPAGRPAVVNFGGYSITMLPRFQTFYDTGVGKTLYKMNVRMYANKSKPPFFSGVENFPEKGLDQGLESFSEREYVRVGVVNFADPTMVAATVFRGKLWVAVGGNSNGVYYIPNHAVYDIYTYDIDPASPNFPFGGKFNRIDRIEYNSNIRSISVASFSTLEQQAKPGGGTEYVPTPKLSFFAASATDTENPIQVRTSTDGKLSNAPATTYKGNIKAGSDISAVMTIDSHAKPLVALGWSSTTGANPQSGLGIAFFDGATFVGHAPTLTGTQGVPIPQCVRLAAGGVRDNSAPGNYLQVFGRLKEQIARWQYEITGANGTGRWSMTDVKRPLALGGSYSTLYPDNFCAFSSTETLKHADTAEGPVALTYYKNSVGVIVWQANNNYDEFEKGTLYGTAYQSDQLIPYGVIPNSEGESVPTQWVTSSPRGMGDPAYSDAWTLLGVFHGVPTSLVGIDPTTHTMTANGGTLIYQQKSSTQVDLTSTYTTSVSTGYENEEVTDILGLETSFKYELSQTVSTSNRVDSTIQMDEGAGSRLPNTGYMLFLSPAVQATLYRRTDPYEKPIVLNRVDTTREHDLYSEIFVGKVVRADSILVSYNMVNPNADIPDNKGQSTRSSLYSAGMATRPAANDLAGWNKVFPADNANYASPDGMRLGNLRVEARGGGRTSTLTWGSSKSLQKSTTVSLDIKASLFGAFAAVGTSTTTSVSTQYATDTSISLGLNYPEQIGNTFSYSVQPYFFKAINVDKCDFIPTKYRTYQTFQPFLVTYHSDGNVRASAGPELTLDLAGKTANTGEKVQFEVIAKSKTPITYQWFFNGQALVGQTKRVLTIYKADASDAGTYHVKLTNALGVTQSASAPLEVLGAPIVSGALAGGNVAPDQDLILQSKFTGLEPIRYQWYVNGLAVRTGTGKNFRLPASQISPEGTDVEVVATNALGSAEDATTVTADSQAPRATGSALFAGNAVSPGEYQNLSVGVKFYDIVLLQGQSVTAKAKPGHVTRLPFIDKQGDLCVVEFSGAGTVTLSIPGGVLVPTNPNFGLVAGLPDIIVSHSTASTYLSVFSLGAKPAKITPATLLSDPTAGRIARIHSLEVDGVVMGGINLANAWFLGTRGNLGILAPSLNKVRYVYVGDMNAQGTAVPNLTFSAKAAIPVISGGDLSQGNGRSVLTSGISEITFVRTLRGNGVLGPLPKNAAIYVDVEKNQTTVLTK